MNAQKPVALEKRLYHCKNVITMGVKTNFSDYTCEERKLILQAEKIYYPSTFYADLFDAMGKKTFPTYHTYKCVQDKIKQSALFDMLNIPHPKTRVYYGKRWVSNVFDSFAYPFIAKIPRGSAMGRGVFLIQNDFDLKTYSNLKKGPAYIQQYLPIERDIRAVIIGKKVVHAYWRVAGTGEFRTNISLGGKVSLDKIPDQALELALTTARLCQWDDVGVDICMYEGKFYVIEANMKYGKQGFKAAGIDYIQLMDTLIANGDI